MSLQSSLRLLAIFGVAFNVLLRPRKVSGSLDAVRVSCYIHHSINTGSSLSTFNYIFAVRIVDIFEYERYKSTPSQLILNLRGGLFDLMICIDVPPSTFVL